MKIPEWWCSGIGFFPDGKTCPGCPDCREDIEWEYPPEPDPTPEQLAYRERVRVQIEKWVEGNPQHNTVDDECCPDFSCCKPQLLQPEEVRKTFKAANSRQRESLLFTFLGASISLAFEEKGIKSKVYIANGLDELKKDVN